MKNSEGYQKRVSKQYEAKVCETKRNRYGVDSASVSEEVFVSTRVTDRYWTVNVILNQLLLSDKIAM